MYASLKEVAASAGVSFQTASKVLNGHPGVVSDRTRQRILDVAKDLGYVPNALARGLVSQSTLTVGMIVDDLADRSLSQFVRAAERAAAGEGHTTLIVAASPQSDPALAVRKLHEHRVGGILVVAPSLEEDSRLGEALRGPLPAVSVNHVHGGGVPLVGSDHSETGRLAAQHLLDLGHRRVATITGPRGRRVVRSRHGGFRTTLLNAEVALPPRRVVEADWTTADAYAAAHRLLDTDSTVTALFAHSDEMALGVLQALRDRGRSVPDDCSVVGCDDADFASYLAPALTTVSVPFERTGEAAMALLLQRMRGESTPPRVLYPTHLVIRRSTAPCAYRAPGEHPTSAVKKTRPHASDPPKGPRGKDGAHTDFRRGDT